MAIIPQGILGHFSGRIGNLVGCICTTRSDYLRTVPLCYHDAKTEAQLRNRAKMKAGMAFLSVAKEFVNHTLGGQAERITAVNMATRINFHKVDLHDITQAKPIYSEWKLSTGRLAPLASAMVMVEEGRLMLAWERMAGANGMEDSVSLMVYDETRHKGVTKIGVCRRGDGVYRVALPARWTEDRLHVYVAVEDGKGETFSESQYFLCDGTGRGVELAERGLVQLVVGQKEACSPSEQSAIKEQYGTGLERAEEEIEEREMGMPEGGARGLGAEKRPPGA